MSFLHKHKNPRLPMEAEADVIRDLTAELAECRERCAEAEALLERFGAIYGHLPGCLIDVIEVQVCTCGLESGANRNAALDAALSAARAEGHAAGMAEARELLRGIRDILVRETDIPEASIAAALTVLDHHLGLVVYTEADIKWGQERAAAIRASDSGSGEESDVEST